MKSKASFCLVLLTFVASLISVVHAQTFSVLHSFTGSGGQGTSPAAGVTIRGNALYGTTSGGIGCGTVYQLTHSGSDWRFSTVAALPDDCNPLARVVFGPDSHLYGTSVHGGTYTQGTVFKLTPLVGICKTVACYWTVTDIHAFGSATDGALPFYGDLIWDQQGNTYGTTGYGGTSGQGTVYELMPSKNGYTESVLYSFSGRPDGTSPANGLVFDKNGNLFGTTDVGGANDHGTVFELTYIVGTGWTEHVLHDFQRASDGAYPFSGLISDSSGNLYGATHDGGSGGAGTVFELSPSGNTWTFKLLYSFPGRSYCGPQATLSMDGAGNLYGTTICGGIYNNGNVFKLSKGENGWVYTSLHDFTGGADGGFVYSNVTIDTEGSLYGTTEGGGDPNCQIGGCGVVWMIKP